MCSEAPNQHTYDSGVFKPIIADIVADIQTAHHHILTTSAELLFIDKQVKQFKYAHLFRFFQK